MHSPSPWRRWLPPSPGQVPLQAGTKRKRDMGFVCPITHELFRDAVVASDVRGARGQGLARALRSEDPPLTSLPRPEGGHRESRPPLAFLLRH